LRSAILFGEDAAFLEKVFDQSKVKRVKDLKEAVKQANTIAQPKDAVLLAPACASFDMFDNFEHRGECFVELIGKLK